MKSPLTTFCKLYLPLILATLLIVAVFNSRVDDHGSHLEVMPLGGLISFDVPVKSRPVVMFTGWLVALIILSSYLFFDYAEIFQGHFRMEVFYDKRGLDKALRRLGALGDEIKLAPNADRLRQEHYLRLNEEIASVTGIAGFLGKEDETMHSHGRTSFIVEKCAGIQKYRIAEADGELTHVMEVPRSPTMQLTTLFEHLPSGHDHVDIRLADLFFCRGILLLPWFKQSLAEDRRTQAVIWRSRVIGATRVTAFPWPDISPTVYLADLGEEGYVPLGYSVYM